ncbi:MAG: dTDP-4-dehydrorhamnose reductase [Hyphomonadaceae bacterium]
MSILVIGKQGQVARALMRRAAAHNLEVQLLGRPEFDLERVDAAAIAAHRPQVVINAAAYTAVDRAESEAGRAFLINAIAAEAVAAAAASVHARVIQVSTDYVFSGEKTEPYVETDATEPATIYGQSKLAGERGALKANPSATIVRTAWVYDASGANFVRTMLRLAKSRSQLNVVADQRGCPTFADDLADALLKVATKGGSAGIYHAAGAGDVSWAEFAQEIFAQSAARGGPSAQISAISGSEYPTAARRPTNSRLDCGKFAQDYGVRLRPWREALAQCLDEMAAGGWRVE